MSSNRNTKVLPVVVPAYQGESDTPFFPDNASMVIRWGITSSCFKNITLSDNNVLTCRLYHPVYELAPWSIPLPNKQENNLGENQRQYQNLLSQSYYLPLELPYQYSVNGLQFLGQYIPAPKWAIEIMEKVKGLNLGHNLRQGNVHMVQVGQFAYSTNAFTLLTMGISQSHINKKNGRVVGRYHPVSILDKLLDTGHKVTIGDKSPMYATLLAKQAKLEAESLAKLEQAKLEQATLELAQEQAKLEQARQQAKKARIAKAKKAIGKKKK